MADETPGYYDYLPYETAELYKRYGIEIGLPSAEEYAADESHALRIAEVAAHAGASMLDFDVFISEYEARSRRTEAEVREGRAVQAGMNAGIEGLGNFIANAARRIDINVGKGRESRMKVLVVNASHLALPIRINVGENAGLSLIEFYTSVSEKRSVCVPLHEIQAGKGSRVEINMIHNGNENSELLSLLNAHAAERARLKVNAVYSGSAKSKGISILRAGESGHVESNEIVYGTDAQQFDINTFIINEGERSAAKLESAAVLDEGARCIFKGFAKINKWVKGAKSKVTERGMLLGMEARMDALPDMSIDYSDGVSAMHSAATMPPDNEELFYLMSRGISEEEAGRLSVASFISKYLSGIENPFASEIASSLILRRIYGEGFENIPKITSRGMWYTASDPWNGNGHAKAR